MLLHYRERFHPDDEQYYKLRRAYHKEFAKRLRPIALQRGWCKREDIVYRLDDGWVVTAIAMADYVYDETGARVMVKPWELDEFFWPPLLGYCKEKLTLADRALAGATVVPPLLNTWWDEDGLSIEDNIHCFLDHADDAIAMSKPLRQRVYSDFIRSHVDPHGRDDYGAIAIAALLMEAKPEQALALLEDYACGRREMTTKWSVVDRDYFEDARAYLREEIRQNSLADE